MPGRKDFLDDYLTIAAIAEAEDLDSSSIWRYVRDGRLPARRIGWLWVIRRADYEAWRRIRRKPGRARGFR